MEQLVSYWMDLNEILFIGILQKSVEKMQVWSKSDKNNCTFFFFSLGPVRITAPGMHRSLRLIVQP
jgi:hypothetical protein